MFTIAYIVASCCQSAAYMHNDYVTDTWTWTGSYHLGYRPPRYPPPVVYSEIHDPSLQGWNTCGHG